MKFKVGDKVKYRIFNNIGTIKEVDENKLEPYRVEFVDDDFIYLFWIPEGGLEVINES